MVLLGKVFTKLEELTVEESSMYPFSLNIAKKVSCLDIRMFKAGENSYFCTLVGNFSSVGYLRSFSKSLVIESKYSDGLEIKSTKSVVLSFA